MIPMYCLIRAYVCTDLKRPVRESRNQYFINLHIYFRVTSPKNLLHVENVKLMEGHERNKGDDNRGRKKE